MKLYIYIYLFTAIQPRVFYNFFCFTRKKNTNEKILRDILVVGTAASVASGSSSGAASASSVGRAASLSATSTDAAVLPPDGGWGLLTDPGRPRGRLRPLGWRLDVAPSSLLGFSLQVLDLDLEHVDQQSEAMW